MKTLIIFLSIFALAHCDAYEEIGIDGYTDYSLIQAPELPMNTTKGEAIEFEAAASTEPVKLPSSIKDTLMSKAINSNEIKANFGEYIIGFLSAWLRSANSLRDVLKIAINTKNECKLDNLYSEYQKEVEKKEKDIHDLAFSEVSELSPSEKIEKCRNNIEKEINQIQEQYEIRNEYITSHKKQIEDYTREKDYESVKILSDMVELHEKAIVDLRRDEAQLKQINCEKISTDQNTSIKLSIIALTKSIPKFMQSALKCLSSFATGETATLLARVSEDVFAFVNAGQIESLFHVITFGTWNTIKAVYHTIMFGFALGKVFKTYKGKRWDEFAYNIGKSVGFSIRIVLCFILGKR